MGKYRHELKYVISFSDYLAIRSRVRAVMKPDAHAGSDGKYLIRSVYFDNYNDKALAEKLDGVQKREKFRIRWYNDDMSCIHLEKKMKINSLCLKQSALLTASECRCICESLSGDSLKSHSSELVRELANKMVVQQLRPRVLVSYVREAYVYKSGNVRVTFDSHIRTGLFFSGFFQKAATDISASDSPGDIVLEVKYDEYLPEIIAALIQTEGIRQQAYSKYGACRRFG